jgi:Cu(I)/Ag(I) efflux system membrane fusion protein
VDFTGAPVRRGEPLLSLYSPMLVAAQEELILARRLVDETADQGGRAAENARALLESARRRLGYWDVAPDQVEAIERSGELRRALVLRSPASGLVVEKNVVRGSRVLPGTNLYRIADLSRVWVEGEVFEKDLALVSVGREVKVSLTAYPGQSFEGRVSYLHPTLSAESRTGRVRVELANPELRLKPGMYAQITFQAPIHLEGLHIPRSAVLTTGTRSVVFVRAADGTLVPREVTVGLAAGDHVEVLAGLEAGEIVVSSANFLVDAEANLGMALDGMDMGGAAGGHDEHGAPVAPSIHDGH